MTNASNPTAPLQGQGPGSPVPSLLGIFPRVLMITFGITGISFAVSLFVGILCMAMMGIFRGHLPDMRLAYRLFALPVAAMVGIVAFVVAGIVEFRHYRQAKLLNKKELEQGR
jgi:uncharacterized membrane protein